MRRFATLMVGLLSAAAHSDGSQLIEGNIELSPLDVFPESDACPESIVLPLGDFQMGGPLIGIIVHVH